MLKSPAEKINSDTFNIQHVEESKNIKLCLWGNAAKNPRYEVTLYLVKKIEIILHRCCLTVICMHAFF